MFFLIRASGLHLNRRTGGTLEMESGATIRRGVPHHGLTMWIAADGGTVGSGVTIALNSPRRRRRDRGRTGRAIRVTASTSRLPSGLHPWLAVAGAVALFAVTNLFGAWGFLAVYLAGLVIANRPVRARAR